MTIKVSVAIPARNEEASIGPLLDSLLAQTHPPDEIVVADGGSTDATVARARGYGDRGVRVLELGPAFPGRGRNAAIEAARNPWIALIDAGCVADPGWIEGLLRPLARDPGADEASPRVVYGACRPRLEGEWAKAQALAFLSPRHPKTGSAPPFIASTLLHRSAWQAVGRFPEELRAAEDLLFLDRLRASGLPAASSPEAVVEWSLPLTPSAVFRRFRLYSRYHLAAGLFRTWHLRVLAMDVGALILVALAVGGFLRGAPLAWGALGALMLGAGARVLRTVSRRRANIDAAPFRLDRLLRVSWLLLLADAAAWAGALDFLLARGKLSDAAQGSAR